DPTVLVVRDIERSFGSKKVLRGTSFDLPEASLAGLIGPSGGGKSVLLKIIGGTCRCDRGSAEHEGGGADQIGLMFQEGALFGSISVFDNVAFPLVGGRVPIQGLPPAVRESVATRVWEILARVGLSKAAFKMPAQLSGGMRRRVSLA